MRLAVRSNIIAMLTLFRHDDRQRHRNCQILARIQIYFANIRFGAQIDWASDSHIGVRHKLTLPQKVSATTQFSSSSMHRHWWTNMNWTETIFLHNILIDRLHSLLIIISLFLLFLCFHTKLGRDSLGYTEFSKFLDLAPLGLNRVKLCELSGNQPQRNRLPAEVRKFYCSVNKYKIMFLSF